MFLLCRILDVIQATYFFSLSTLLGSTHYFALCLSSRRMNSGHSRTGSRCAFTAWYSESNGTLWASWRDGNCCFILANCCAKCLSFNTPYILISLLSYSLLRWSSVSSTSSSSCNLGSTVGENFSPCNFCSVKSLSERAWLVPLRSEYALSDPLSISEFTSCNTAYCFIAGLISILPRYPPIPEYTDLISSAIYSFYDSLSAWDRRINFSIVFSLSAIVERICCNFSFFRLLNFSYLSVCDSSLYTDMSSALPPIGKLYTLYLPL